jgi:hypothetical protein
VEKVNPDLVVGDADGKVYSVRYEAVNAMLLNEFLKEHRTVQGQQKEIDALKAELKEQKAFIQKVSDKVELDKPAPQTVHTAPSTCDVVAVLAAASTAVMSGGAHATCAFRFDASAKQPSDRK